MLYHQNICAQVAAESRCRAASHTLSPATSWFDCRQNITCARSRKYQPFPTMPWSRGNVPVRYVACAEQVTAGKTAWMGAVAQPCASARRCGVSSPSIADVSPTTVMTAVRWNTPGQGTVYPG